ncbi:MAG: RNA methyltransferase [Candidatus Dactylopiibacterium carminicum]|uniref:RNA methyltransferase n=1 Tax=Candidatus Dactylopiibacterium carminicum TaxID=857335 RepID=A0A272EP20_9RHOO|nr:THUMP domain-containing protein [Candidatus Dactylopiibacterium carminicum]KAF7598212.1 RNA methyltransferase [Candidatus Dactylopiibacterium carminicum]PAS91864.1 MAG: RNA methyltransferase [Candidatus Dactylopiibacterium carminicum]PAS94839.1 MAG: RNA methyltransferase [Candidatus Dactylopiibacterium carminicum]PAS97007.1 MAG: RNA methyltransferase [Candidatus Dactylopiibacterium carminicum]
MSETFFAPCPRGLEPLLAEELRACGASHVEISHGGVASEGDWAYAYRANLESRIATRLLWKVGFTRYRSEDEIHRLASAVTWARHFDTINSIRINVTAIKSPLKSLNFVTLRIKDGICDHFRAIKGGRPDVDTHNPDMRIHAFLTEDTCTLYLDTSGEPLYKRGFKRAKVEAPLKENLAAGILKLSGWQPGQTLLDPMCGSGTFLIEAAQIALDVAPGLGRSFAFEKFRHFDAELWQSIRKAALARRRDDEMLPIFGADIDPRQISNAEANLEAAGLTGKVELLVCDVLDLDAPDDHGVLVSNPPYGVRLSSGDELYEWYPKLGDALKRGFAGWNSYFLTADLEMAKRLGLKASKRTPLMNGDLDCRVFEFKVVAGSNRP